MTIDGCMWLQGMDVGGNDLIELRCMFMYDTECWDIMTDLYRRGNCEVLGIRVDWWSERTSTGHCDMLEHQLLYQITCCVLTLDDYRTIGIWVVCNDLGLIWTDVIYMEWWSVIRQDFISEYLRTHQIWPY